MRAQQPLPMKTNGSKHQALPMARVNSGPVGLSGEGIGTLSPHTYPHSSGAILCNMSPNKELGHDAA